jgi:hypothetical protein
MSSKTKSISWESPFKGRTFTEEGKNLLFRLNSIGCRRDWGEHCAVGAHGERGARPPLPSQHRQHPRLTPAQATLTHSTENPIYVFSEMKLRGLVPNSYIHVSVSDLYISTLSSRQLRQPLPQPHTLYRKSNWFIPRNETARPRSQFLHSCICERFMYSHDWSAYLAAANI